MKGPVALLREEPQDGDMQGALGDQRPSFELQEAGPDTSTRFSGDWLSQAGAEEAAWASLS